MGGSAVSDEAVNRCVFVRLLSSNVNILCLDDSFFEGSFRRTCEEPVSLMQHRFKCKKKNYLSFAVKLLNQNLAMIDLRDIKYPHFCVMRPVWACQFT